MRFAYHPSMCDPSFYLELGKAAESAGFDVITFPDMIAEINWLLSKGM